MGLLNMNSHPENYLLHAPKDGSQTHKVVTINKLPEIAATQNYDPTAFN